MPSVKVIWKGSCRDPEVRYRLLGYLHRLATLSDRYLGHGEPQRPGFLDILNEQRVEGLPPRPNIETVDQPVSGRILVSSSISPDQDKMVVRAREAGLTVIEPEEDGLPHHVVIDKAQLRGLDFKLYDPRGIYPGEDRMSFVFLECPEHHFLDGRLVEVVVGADRNGIAAAVDAEEICLRQPGIHLRYYLEDWTDCLFSWVRFFFIGDFWWWRGEELQGYIDYRGVFEQVQTERGALPAEEATFDAVLSTFSQHAEHWIGEVQGWAKAEKRHG